MFSDSQGAGVPAGGAGGFVHAPASRTKDPRLHRISLRATLERTALQTSAPSWCLMA